MAGKCRAAPHRWLFHISIDYVAASSISPVLRFNVIRSTRISIHTGVTLLRLDRLALASHLLRAHTHARASTIISSSWSRRPSSSHGKILVASFSPATFCKKKKEFCNMKYSSHYSELCELSSRYVSRRRRKKGKKSSKLLLDIIDILVEGGREKRFVFFSKCSKEFDNIIIFLCACVYFVIFFWFVIKIV